LQALPPVQVPVEPALAGMRRVNFADVPRDVWIANDYLRHSGTSGRLKDEVEQGGHSFQINYVSSAIDFNTAFFARNYLKALLYLDEIPNLGAYDSDPFLDLGGGSGTFSLAAHHFFPQSRFTIVDRSEHQMALAQTLFGLCGLGDFLQCEAADFFETPLPAAPTRLVSYSLCENILQFSDSRERWPILFGAQAIVIDYAEVILAVVDQVVQAGGSASNVVLNEQRALCPDLTRRLGQPQIKFSGACFAF
jgi:hypothetical protein